jgi:pyruvate dehydrogenase E1 component
MAWGFRHMQDDDGGSVYLRLSTRQIAQPARTLSAADRADICAGGYWVVPPAPGADLAIVFTGAIAPEAAEAHATILEDIPGAGLFAATSPDRLHAGWLAAARRRAAGDAVARSHLETLLSGMAPGAALVTVLDGHPATLSWMGSAGDFRVAALGVEKFGQSSDIPDAYRLHGIDAEAILDAAAAACLARLR